MKPTAAHEANSALDQQCAGHCGYVGNELCPVTTPDGERLEGYCPECKDHIENSHGEHPCICPGCDEVIPAWWLGGLCYPCADADCEHEI